MSPREDRDAALEAAIFTLLGERGSGRTISATDAARVVGGDHPDGWGPLMQPIRHLAIRLMKEGRLVIIRKGKPVDPDDFRGVYRLRLPEAGEDYGPGNSALE